MVKEIRGEIMKRLTDATINSIRQAPKPTPISEVVAVTKNFRGSALNLEEIAEIINIAEPGRNVKAKASNYQPISELERHPNLLVTRTPNDCFVRYTDKK
jgi:hypothetical protein